MIRSKQIQRPQLVLVVDDHEINRDALGAILEEASYEVICGKRRRGFGTDAEVQPRVLHRPPRPPLFLPSAAPVEFEALIRRKIDLERN